MKKIILYYIAICLICSGCSDDNEFASGGKVNAGEPATVKLVFQIPSLKKTEIQNRSGSSDPETVIEELDIFIFDGATFESRFSFSETDLEGSGDTKTVKVNLTQGTSRNIYVFANARSILPNDITDLSTLKTASLSSGSQPTSPFMMGGEKLNVNIAALTNFNIVLYRNVAKISAKIKNTTTLPPETFTLDGISLVNAPDKGTLKTTNAFSAEATANYNITTGFSSDPVYTYEALASKSHLIIRGKYNNSATNSFYKVEFRDTDNSVMRLQRNHHYTVNIEKISGKGYSTAAEASKYPASDIVVEIIDTEYEILDMVSNGQYELGVSDTLRLGAIDNLTGSTTVFLNSSDGLNLPTDLGDVLFDNLDPSWITVDTPPSVVIDGNKSKKYTYTIHAAQNPDNTKRTGGIAFYVGNLYKKLVVIQEPRDYITGRDVYLNSGSGYMAKTYWNYLKQDVQGILPSENQGAVINKGLHFNVSQSPAYEYKIKVDDSNITGVAYQDLSGKLNINQSGNEIIVSLNSTAVEDIWSSELILDFTFDDATTRQDRFPIYRTGMFIYENGSNQVMSYNDGNYFKTGTFYYGVVKVGSTYWFDRNLGASSNGFYSIATSSHTGQDINSTGGYYKIRDVSNTSSISKNVLPVCPTGYTVATQEQFSESLAIKEALMSDGESYWLAGLSGNPSASDTEFTAYMPMVGYMQSDEVKGNGGYYWTKTTAYESVDFNSLDLEKKFWQRRLNILTAKPQFLSDRLMTGSNGSNSGYYKGMSIRCIRE